MEIQRFDAITRQLGQDGSRRRLLGLFGGTALGGLLAAGLSSDAEAKKKRKKKKKKKRKPTTPTCSGCGECQTCQNGTCVAAPNGTACSTGTCEDGICRGTTNCPSDRVCELSDICCPVPLETVNGDIVVCPIDEGLVLVCDCAGGSELCIFGGGDYADCCQAGESCNPDVGCVPN